MRACCLHPTFRVADLGIVSIDMAKCPVTGAVSPRRCEAGIVRRSAASVVGHAAGQSVSPTSVPASVVPAAESAEADGAAGTVAVTVIVIRRVGISTAGIGHAALLRGWNGRQGQPSRRVVVPALQRTS